MKTCFLLLLLLSSCYSCQKPDAQTCYTCTSSVTYKTNSPTYKIPAPYRIDHSTCDQAEKANLEQKFSASEPLGGTYTLTKTVQTVCRSTN
ncbi:hypothetical protein [Spirosoma areae]